MASAYISKPGSIHVSVNIHQRKKQMSVLHVNGDHNVGMPPAGDSLLATPMADPDSAVQPLWDTL